MKRMLLAVALGTGAAFGGWHYWTAGSTVMPEVRAAAVTRGDVVATVTATGTTEAVTSVSVGSQVSGTIASLDADFNSQVKKGQVIARLDPALLQAEVEQARANVTRVNADLQQRQMALADKETKLARARTLSDRQLVSASDLGDAQLSVDVAKSDLQAVTAQVTQAEAALNQARLNLSHAVITAPIDGTVIERSVDVGQTVAASLSSPTLFVIAADLSDMRASLSVDESDISNIEPGQPVTLTVSAYPGRRFRGEVAQVRLQPVVTSNVTTYTTIVDVANPALELKPGMTATATIEIARHENALRVPTAAVRFAPTDAIFAALHQAVPQTADASARSARAAAVTTTTEVNGARVVLTSASSGVRPPRAIVAPSASRGTAGRVWVFGEGQLRLVPVMLGLSDGTYTEILANTMEESAADSSGRPVLAEGDAVVASVSTGVEPAKAPAAATSIFGSGAARGRGLR
jgi:HlyD family secretion protein